MLQADHLGVQRAAGVLFEVQAGEGVLALAELPLEHAEERELFVAVHAAHLRVSMQANHIPAGTTRIVPRQPGQREQRDPFGSTVTGPGVLVAPPGGVVGATRTSRGEACRR